MCKSSWGRWMERRTFLRHQEGKLLLLKMETKVSENDAIWLLEQKLIFDAIVPTMVLRALCIIQAATAVETTKDESMMAKTFLFSEYSAYSRICNIPIQ